MGGGGLLGLFAPRQNTSAPHPRQRRTPTQTTHLPITGKCLANRQPGITMSEPGAAGFYYPLWAATRISRAVQIRYAQAQRGAAKRRIGATVAVERRVLGWRAAGHQTHVHASGHLQLSAGAKAWSVHGARFCPSPWSKRVFPHRTILFWSRSMREVERGGARGSCWEEEVHQRPEFSGIRVLWDQSSLGSEFSGGDRTSTTTGGGGGPCSTYSGVVLRTVQCSDSRTVPGAPPFSPAAFNAARRRALPFGGEGEMIGTKCACAGGPVYCQGEYNSGTHPAGVTGRGPPSHAGGGQPRKGSPSALHSTPPQVKMACSPRHARASVLFPPGVN
eukprot:gene16249-biopygen18771